jgi:hypothetical protein
LNLTPKHADFMRHQLILRLSPFYISKPRLRVKD